MEVIAERADVTRRTFSRHFEALELARAGAVSVHTETYSLDDAPLAHERLHEGRVDGRAVILPNG